MQGGGVTHQKAEMLPCDWAGWCLGTILGAKPLSFSKGGEPFILHPILCHWLT